MFKFIPILLLGALAMPTMAFGDKDDDETPPPRSAAAREAEELQKYDEDGDGVLSHAEKQKLRADKREAAKKKREERKQKRGRNSNGIMMSNRAR